jgi:PAS domain S-box-containing protein
MTSKDNRPAQAAELRRQAEAKLSERRKKAAALPATESDPQRLVHELEVHQIELTMQNEELLQSRAQVDAGLRQYTDLYDFAPVGYFSLARDGAIHQVNLAGANLLGIERGVLIKRRFGAFVFALSLTTFNTFLKKAFGSQQNETCEVALQKDGSAPLWVHIEATISDASSGEREMCHAVVSNITEHKRTEEVLRENEQRLRTFLDSTSDMAFLKDDSCRHIIVNRALCKFYGKKESEIIGKTDFDLMAEKAAANCRKTDEQTLRSNDLQISEEVVGSRYYETMKFPVTIANGKRGIGAYIRDITDRKRSDEELLRLNAELEKTVAARTKELHDNQLALLNLVDDLNQSAKNIALALQTLEATNKELEAFSYSVSHDLRAPLRGMDGFSQTLLEDYGDKLDATGKNYLERIRAGTQRMGSLIDDMLKLSQVTRVEFKRESVDLSKMVRTILLTVRRNNPARDVKVSIQKDIIIDGDRHLLEIALTNLIDNAWKFTGKTKNARIEFGTLLKDGKPVIFIRDNGVGFDMAYVDKLFGAFQRLHTTAEFPGTGIGLATVQRVIHRHGGKIWAEGEVGKGATFFFTIP